MNEPPNSRYERRFPDPEKWPSNRIASRAVEETRRSVNELSWALAGEQVADEVSRFLKAEWGRQERQRAAQADGRWAGEPGE